MKKHQNDKLWKDVSLLCQLLGHLLSDLAEKGGFVGRVTYETNVTGRVPDLFCGWADAKIRFRDVWKQFWGDYIMPASKRGDIYAYAESMKDGAKLPPIMICHYDDGEALVDGNRRCSALMRLTPEERRAVVMGAFIIDLRTRNEAERDSG